MDLSVFPDLKKAHVFTDAVSAIRYASELYDASVSEIRKTFDALLQSSTIEGSPSEACYPFIGIAVEAKDLNLDERLSYGVLWEPGVYGATLTHLELFAPYYEKQVELLIQRHKVSVVVGLSSVFIPMPYVMDQSTESPYLDPRWEEWGFVLPNLSRIHDRVPNGSAHTTPCKPLSLFEAERTDYSLHRLHHYTGTACDHFQGFVLLTNYQRYLDPFIDFSRRMLLEDSNYTALVGPDNRVLTAEDLRKNPKAPFPLAPHQPQMPAYHLKRKDKEGITFINIGVGPSNARNITEHLAVLRPHCWLMLGHCAGLRATQQLGDYVLAHAYVREDHVLDQELPLWVPIPALAEIQVALQHAVQNIICKESLKERMRTGTVVTTDNRNWELRSLELGERFQKSRAIAVDMESATIAANGFRFRVPYGTLLCISDKPLHGELKLKGMANTFYRQRVNQHLDIGLEAVRILREAGVDQLHSRKLRGFEDPPFR